MKQLLSILSLVLIAHVAYAKPKIQNEDVRSYSDIQAAALTTTGNLTNANHCISSPGTTTGLSVGLFIYDSSNPSYITVGTTIAGLPGSCSAGQIQMSANANHAATGDTITFGGQLSQLVNDSKMYVTGASLNDQLSTLLSNNNIINSSSTTSATLAANLSTTKNIVIGSSSAFTDVALYVIPPVTQLSGSTQWGQATVLKSSSSATTGATAGYFDVETPASTSIGAVRGLHVDSATVGSGGSISNYYGVYAAGDTPGSTSYAFYSAGSAPSVLGGNLRVLGGSTLLNKSSSTSGLGGGLEAANSSSTYSGIIADSSGRGFRIGSSDFNDGTNTGSILKLGLGGNGNTYSVVGAYSSGSSASAKLALNPDGGNVGVGTSSPNSLLEVAGDIASSGSLKGTGANGAMPIQGTNTNDSASSGNVGQYLQAVTLRASAVTLSSSSFSSIITSGLTLTVGDWDVCGQIGFNGSSSTITQIEAALSTSNTSFVAPTNTYGATDVRNVSVFTMGVSLGSLNVNNGDTVGPLSCYRASLSVGETIYLMVNNIFSSGTMNGYGRITARRAR